MFNTRNKSKNPVGVAFDTFFDTLIPKKEKSSHKVRNGLIGTGIVVGVASLLTKKKPKP